MYSDVKEKSEMSERRYKEKINQILYDHINEIEPLQSKPEIENKSMDMVQKVIEIVKPGYLIEIV